MNTLPDDRRLTATMLPPFVENARGLTPRTIHPRSHFRDQVLRPGITSRRWADASPEVKAETMHQVIRYGKALGMDRRDLSFTLAVAYIESGFNPGAAAGSTSASGVGQMVDRTAYACGVDPRDRFEPLANVRGFVTYLFRKLMRVEQELPPGQADTYSHAYGYYHDGEILSVETLAYSRSKVPGLVRLFEEWFQGNPSVAEIEPDQGFDLTLLPDCR